MKILKKMPLFITALGLLTSSLIAAEPIAHFDFNENAKDLSSGEAKFRLKNTSYKDNALYLNGTYTHNGTGYTASCKVPKLNYSKFAMALKFMPEPSLFYSVNPDFERTYALGSQNIITGGGSHRWLGLKVYPNTNNLMLTLNNGDFIHVLTDASPIKQGEWNTVSCNFDLAAKKIIIYVNGFRGEDIDLPKGFNLRVFGSRAENSDKAFTFDYSGGGIFKGYADELIVYNDTLPEEQLKKLLLEEKKSSEDLSSKSILAQSLKRKVSHKISAHKMTFQQTLTLLKDQFKSLNLHGQELKISIVNEHNIDLSNMFFACYSHPGTPFHSFLSSFCDISNAQYKIQGDTVVITLLKPLKAEE